jgi:hypothetical protein
MLRMPALLEQLARDGEARQWFSAKWRQIVDEVIAAWQELGNIDIAQLVQKLPPALASEFAALALEGENLSDSECARMASDCLAYLRRKHVKGLERDLRIAIRAAEEQKDEQVKRERMLEWQDLLRKERQLERPRPEPKITIR